MISLTQLNMSIHASKQVAFANLEKTRNISLNRRTDIRIIQQVPIPHDLHQEFLVVISWWLQWVLVRRLLTDRNRYSLGI